MSTYLWHENGWYDCCSGCWFVNYELVDKEGNFMLQTSNEDSVFLYSAVLGRLGISTCDDKTLSILDSVVELMEELGTVVSDEYLKEYGIEVVIDRDESIDYSMTHTCMD